MILTRSVAGPLPYFSDGHGSARDECASRILTGPKDSVSVRIEIGCGRGHGSNVRPESPGKGLGSKAAVGFTRTLGKSERVLLQELGSIWLIRQETKTRKTDEWRADARYVAKKTTDTEY